MRSGHALVWPEQPRRAGPVCRETFRLGEATSLWRIMSAALLIVLSLAAQPVGEAYVGHTERLANTVRMPVVALLRAGLIGSRCPWLLR